MNYENHEFMPWPKMARLSRECLVTEKLDGTNACVYIVPTRELSCMGDLSLATVHGDAMVEGAVTIFAGSRTRWIQPGNDNYGFAAWVRDNAVELAKLGPGRHFGEWFGAGIQRHYGLKEKRFSLFNASRWAGCPQNGWKYIVDLNAGIPGQPGVYVEGPSCCSVVPVLYRGSFSTQAIDLVEYNLQTLGSVAAPGFMNPEGIVVYHTAAKICFKRTLGDDGAKGAS